MTRDELLLFMRGHRYAVQASVASSGAPQAAVVGIVVSDDFEIVFDTLDSSRKVANLRHNAKIACVIGGLDGRGERTVQYEGVADEPVGSDLDRLMELYFAGFPDGRDRSLSSSLTYVRVKPTWIRFSDFSRTPPEIVEFDIDTLIGA